MDNLDYTVLTELLEAVGAHLGEGGNSATIVVVGGSTLALQGWVERTTTDVDVIAQASEQDGQRILTPANPLPDPLLEAVARVGRDYGLAEDWLNTAVGAQWDFGLPPGFADELTWRRYGALEVGFAGRSSLIALKLFATVDNGPASVHFQDLVRLSPTEAELNEAARWVEGQDAGSPFPNLVAEALEHVRHTLGRGRHPS